ncbi:unnamed protein product [Ostreobium quekettii]|uniref:Uncharacterized protein n=1 Tax=Ostreobium quekettii TaxID=121088 RepID=A0A8S1INN6_9CHLO|nr:unnamed protein product [Ostreobium quekettii]
MTRDVAPCIGHHKPALIESRFFPALQGISGKVNANDTTTAIYTKDTPKEIKSKISKHAYSGGHPTIEEHREKGANLDVDIPSSICPSFWTMMRSWKRSGEVKADVIQLLQELVVRHQAALSNVRGSGGHVHGCQAYARIVSVALPTITYSIDLVRLLGSRMWQFVRAFGWFLGQVTLYCRSFPSYFIGQEWFTMYAH